MLRRDGALEAMDLYTTYRGMRAGTNVVSASIVASNYRVLKSIR